MNTTWAWRKSSRSATNGDCVEIGRSADTPLMAVRDSKSGDGGPILTFGRGEIAALLRAAARA